MVALHPEGVDRNPSLASNVPTMSRSPSTRRAWIEIRTKPSPRKKCVVALHPEGVDRNKNSKCFAVAGL